MSAISRSILKRLPDREFRNAYRRARVRTLLAYQIRAIRKKRGWLQGMFAEALKKPQSVASRYEDPGYGKYTLETLHDIADAFDCGLVVKFEPYQDFLIKTSDLTAENLLAEAFNANYLHFLETERKKPIHTSGASSENVLVGPWKDLQVSNRDAAGGPREILNFWPGLGEGNPVSIGVS